MSIVRAMNREDIAAVAELERQIFSRPWSEQGFLDALEHPDTIFLVAEETDRISGYIGMYLAVDEGEITNVAVAPDARRRGIGQELLLQMKREAKHHAITRLILEVRLSNAAAIALYEKNGFSIAGVRKGFYECPKEDAYIMICGQ